MTGALPVAVTPAGPQAEPVAPPRPQPDDIEAEHDSAPFPEFLTALLTLNQEPEITVADATSAGEAGDAEGDITGHGAGTERPFLPMGGMLRPGGRTIPSSVAAGSTMPLTAAAAEGPTPPDADGQRMLAPQPHGGEAVPELSIRTAGEARAPYGQARVQELDAPDGSARDPARIQRAEISLAEFRAVEGSGPGGERVRLDPAPTEGPHRPSPVAEPVVKTSSTMPGNRLALVVNEHRAGRIVLRLFDTPTGANLAIRAAAPETYELLRSHFGDIELGVARHGVTLQRISGVNTARREREAAGSSRRRSGVERERRQL